MRDFERLAELARSGEPFALATVVGRRAPVSAELGDRAVIFADGRMEGFVGGACARDIVRARALGALERGRALLLSIRPGLPTEPASDGEEIERLVVPMGCASEGAIEIYIEPHLPRRPLVVVGFTPVAGAVARIAGSLEFDVTRFVQPNELPHLEPNDGVSARPLSELGAFLEQLGARVARLAAVVASQGHYDESALERLLTFRLEYLGVLASRKRMEVLRGALTQAGAAAENLRAVRNPIGLDIGARAPGEIALAILAEIVASAPPGLPVEDVASVAAAATPLATDPVCGMSVEPGDSQFPVAHAGTTYYFCCDGCARRFAAEPERFAGALERA